MWELMENLISNKQPRRVCVCVIIEEEREKRNYSAISTQPNPKLRVGGGTGVEAGALQMPLSVSERLLDETRQPRGERRSRVSVVSPRQLSAPSAQRSCFSLNARP